MDLPPRAGAGPESTGNKNEEGEAFRQERPRIYVASLADYNAGILHGDWIDADQEPDELQEQISSMLARSPTPSAEEFAIHDFEGFGHFRPNEYDGLERISRVAGGIIEHGQAFGAWAELCGSAQESLERFDEAFLGEWRSLIDYVEELLGDLGYLDLSERVPEAIAPYVHVDVEAFARDLELSGDITAVEHALGVWLFDGRL